ncbi:putative signal peptidase complex subunit 1 [Apostasia shenzhenica]|uniref:Signal peptidase complex subunit 1 n=1 Tax=Apostasia shenzhenica TaxID=1088818 RepID=A0A2H9ZZK3_9ASPA|nr:putative signal peptidase complex subunit 1 [Apostasia shenzhenica]
MDWQGQKLAEKLMEILLMAFAVASFVVGYAIGSFQIMLLVYASGVLLTVLITVPNWSFFNRHSLNWLDPAEAGRHPKSQATVLPSSKKKTSKLK